MADSRPSALGRGVRLGGRWAASASAMASPLIAPATLQLPSCNSAAPVPASMHDGHVTTDIQRMEEDPPALRSRSHSRSESASTARATLGTHVIKFLPTERCDVSRLDPEDLLSAVSSFATDAELRKLQLLRVSTISNTITVTTCDSKQAAHLVRTTTYQLPTEGISRGVIHGCKPNESPEKLLSALHADGVDILSARPMGSRGTALIIFASPRPPSKVTYWPFPRRVERCHKPGHKAAVCPAEKPVCANCGKQQDQAPEQCPHADENFCVRCNDSGHVATDASSPARAQFGQKVKEREDAKQERRSRIRTRRRRRSRNPKLDSTTQPTSRSSSETRDSQFLAPPRVPSKVRLQPNHPTFATAVTSLPELDTPATRTEAQIQLIQAAQLKDKEEFQAVLARIQQQMAELQRQYNNRQKTRDGQIGALQRRLAAETEQYEIDLEGRAKRHQSRSPGRARCEAAESPAPTKQARQELPQRLPTPEAPPAPQNPPKWLQTFLQQQQAMLQQHHQQTQLQLQQHI
ncbi:hypothetical protein HPB47_009399 [Ixodes persulcatus]|uniref:Uncharacterized protein n=1 Tax=Ixodes persulcatus TaxID=34615 RepID=A0AC60P201_IXOPE|nr:hypothetical protein HPB47_009399 [Ixodes persulcatus]